MAISRVDSLLMIIPNTKGLASQPGLCLTCGLGRPYQRDYLTNFCRKPMSSAMNMKAARMMRVYFRSWPSLVRPLFFTA